MSVQGVSKANKEGIECLQRAHYLLQTAEWDGPRPYGSMIYDALKRTNSQWWTTAYTWVMFTVEPQGRMTLFLWEKGNPTKEDAMNLVRRTIKRIIDAQPKD